VEEENHDRCRKEHAHGDAQEEHQAHDAAHLGVNKNLGMSHKGIDGMYLI